MINADGKVVVQPRCPACGGEQYAPAVAAFTAGRVCCDRCSVYTRPMDGDEYAAAIVAAGDRAAAAERAVDEARVPAALAGVSRRGPGAGGRSGPPSTGTGPRWTLPR